MFYNKKYLNYGKDSKTALNQAKPKIPKNNVKISKKDTTPEKDVITTEIVKWA